MLGIPDGEEDRLETPSDTADRVKETPVEKDPWETAWEEIVSSETEAFQRRLEGGFTPDDAAYTGLTVTDHAL